MCTSHSVLECCVTFSGVKLSIRSFVLFLKMSLFCFLYKDATCNLMDKKLFDTQDFYF